MVNILVNCFYRLCSPNRRERMVLCAVPVLITFFSNLVFCNTALAATEDDTRMEVHRAGTGQEALSAIFRRKFLLDSQNKHLARAVTIFNVQAPAHACKEVLSDFPKFPEFMKRVKSVQVVRHEGNMFFTQSYLKPQLLVNQPLNHTITDVYSKPNTIEWVLVDGNFPSAQGRWEIEPVTSGSCRVTYTVAVEPGPFVPPHLVSFALKLVQREVISGVKDRVELFARQAAEAESEEPRRQADSKVRNSLRAHLAHDPA